MISLIDEAHCSAVFRSSKIIVSAGDWPSCWIVNPGLGMKPDPMSMFATFPTLQIIRLPRPFAPGPQPMTLTGSQAEMPWIEAEVIGPRVERRQLTEPRHASWAAGRQVDRRSMKLASITVFGQLQ